MSTEEPELSESSDEDTQNKFYLESPHEEMIIETIRKKKGRKL